MTLEQLTGLTIEQLENMSDAELHQKLDPLIPECRMESPDKAVDKYQDLLALAQKLLAQ